MLDSVGINKTGGKCYLKKREWCSYADMDTMRQLNVKEQAYTWIKKRFLGAEALQMTAADSAARQVTQIDEMSRLYEVRR